MKKLITLLIVLICCVCTVGADNITKRIVVITSGNFQKYKGDNNGLAIHAWYADGSGDIHKKNSNDEHMYTLAKFNPSDEVEGVWCYDIVFDETKSIKFEVYNWGNTDWHSADNSQQTVFASSDKYYYWNSENNGALSERGTLAFYAYLYDGTSVWTKQALTSTDGENYKTTIDNYSNFNSALKLIIAPSFAIDDDAFKDKDYKWKLIYRPQANLDAVFYQYINYNGGCYSEEDNSDKKDNNITLAVKAKYDLTYLPFSWKFSLSPYIEKTIGSTTQYVTLGTPTDWKMKVPTDVTAYYVSGVENNAATMSSEITAGNTLPGNNGYIIKGTNNQTYKFYASNADPVSISTNLLKSTGATDATPDKSGVYILALNDNNEAAFFPYSGSGAIGAFKAYLQTGGGAKSISLNFDETTNINLNVNENLNSAAPMYNIAGQRVANNYKGIVIQNGKKFINK